MNPLLYSSNEMFSSTELIRKSKMIFDKLLSSEVEKAIILRDGKPGFMLLDFDKYETLMKEYLALKEKKTLEVVSEQKEEKSASEVLSEPAIEEKIEVKEETEKPLNKISVQESVPEDLNKIEDDISEDDLKKALEEIENLNFEEKDMKEDKKSLDEDDLNELSYQKKQQPLKEFWD